MCIWEKHIFHNEISPHFKFLSSNERLDFCIFLGLTMQIHFHSLLWSYLPRVLISLAVTVYLCVCGYDSQVWFCWEFSDWTSNRLTSLIIKIRERLIISGDTGNGSRMSVCSQLQWLHPDRSPRQARWPLTERRQERRPPSSQTVQCPLTSSPTQPVSGAFTNTTAKGCFNNQNHVLAYW